MTLLDDVRRRGVVPPAIARTTTDPLSMPPRSPDQRSRTAATTLARWARSVNRCTRQRSRRTACRSQAIPPPNPLEWRALRLFPSTGHRTRGPCPRAGPAASNVPVGEADTRSGQLQRQGLRRAEMRTDKEFEFSVRACLRTRSPGSGIRARQQGDPRIGQSSLCPFCREYGGIRRPCHPRGIRTSTGVPRVGRRFSEPWSPATAAPTRSRPRFSRFGGHRRHDHDFRPSAMLPEGPCPARRPQGRGPTRTGDTTSRHGPSSSRERRRSRPLVCAAMTFPDGSGSSKGHRPPPVAEMIFKISIPPRSVPPEFVPALVIVGQRRERAYIIDVVHSGGGWHPGHPERTSGQSRTGAGLLLLAVHQAGLAELRERWDRRMSTLVREATGTRCRARRSYPGSTVPPPASITS